jgi:hypothetical protein
MTTNGRVPAPGETTLGAVSMRCSHCGNRQQQLRLVLASAPRERVVKSHPRLV